VQNKWKETKMFAFILWIVLSIAIWYFYHKIFTVYYFNLYHGLLNELGVTALLGALLTWLTLTYWMIALAIVILVFAMLLRNQLPREAVTVMSIIAIVLLVCGLSSLKSCNKSKTSSSSSQQTSASTQENSPNRSYLSSSNGQGAPNVSTVMPKSAEMEFLQLGESCDVSVNSTGV
jgi:glucan phosphoethanolaminetransferase (alkaline phosphatase superfamily)